MKMEVHSTNTVTINAFTTIIEDFLDKIFYIYKSNIFEKSKCKKNSFSTYNIFYLLTCAVKKKVMYILYKNVT